MASILKVDELQGIASAGDITVTSEGGSATQSLQQGLAKVLFCMNLSTITYLTVPNNSLSTQTLNVSSGTDAGTGLARGNLTNAMNALDYIWAEGIKAGNNTANLDVGVATTSLIPFQQHDADSSVDTEQLSCATVFGGLA